MEQKRCSCCACSTKPRNRFAYSMPMPKTIIYSRVEAISSQWAVSMHTQEHEYEYLGLYHTEELGKAQGFRCLLSKSELEKCRSKKVGHSPVDVGPLHFQCLTQHCFVEYVCSDASVLRIGKQLSRRFSLSRQATGYA